MIEADPYGSHLIYTRGVSPLRDLPEWRPNHQEVTGSLRRLKVSLSSLHVFLSSTFGRNASRRNMPHARRLVFTASAPRVVHPFASSRIVRSFGMI